MDGRKRKKQKPQRPLLEPVSQQPAEAAGDGNSKFARALGSTDYVTREKGLQALSRFLVYKRDMSELDMLKLWKGLFFCFWHSDKVPVQTELAERLAGLLPQMQQDMAHLYFSAFLAMMRREWPNMDHHRLNKFLMLVRKFVASLFGMFKAAAWDAALISSYTGQGQLSCQQELVPCSEHRSAGLTFHLADLWLPELSKAAAEEPVPRAALQQLLEPFVQGLAQCKFPALLGRIRESVFESLVQQLQEAEHGKDEGKGVYLQQLDVRQLAEQLFELASDSEVRAGSREALYALHADLERLLGKKRKPSKHKGTAAAAAAGASKQQQQQQAEVAAADVDALPSAEKKKKNKKHKQQQQQAEQEGMELDIPAPSPVSRGSDQQQHQQRQQAGDASPSGRAAATAMELDGEAPFTGKTPKKKKKQQQQQQQQQEEAAGVPDAGGLSTSKQAASPEAAAAAAAGAKEPATLSGKKRKKQQQRQGAEAGPSTPAAASRVADLGTPGQGKLKNSALRQGSSGGGVMSLPQSAPPKLKQGRLQSLGTMLLTPAAKGPAPGAAAAVTPHGSGAKGLANRVATRAASTGKKRGVVINEKKNLYFAHGAPPPAADIRTPPRAQPKGSALKKSSRLGPAPASAPPKSAAAAAAALAAGSAHKGHGGFGPRRAVTPNSVPRARAASFF